MFGSAGPVPAAWCVSRRHRRRLASTGSPRHPGAVHRRARQNTAPPVDVIFALGGFASEVKWQAPHLTWLVDNPVWSQNLVELRPDVDGVFVVAAEHVEVATHFVGMSCPVAFLPHGINVPEDRCSASRLGVTKQRADSLSLQAQRESGRQHARGRSQARNERPTEADLLPVFYPKRGRASLSVAP